MVAACFGLLPPGALFGAKPKTPAADVLMEKTELKAAERSTSKSPSNPIGSQSSQQKESLTEDAQKKRTFE